MTVTSSSSSISYATAGLVAGQTLQYPYKLFSAADLQVSCGAVQAIANTHYTVAIAADYSSATVTITAAMLSLIAGLPDPLLIVRDMEFTQDINFDTNSSLPAPSLENAFDRAAMRDQQLKQEIADIAQPSAAVIAFATTYFGALPADPPARPLDGSPLQNGDSYFNTTNGRGRVYMNGAWGDQAISTDALAQIGFRTSGDVFPSMRITTPAYCCPADGRALSRASYPKTFAAVTLVFAADVTAGLQQLQNVTKDLRGVGLEGATLEIPAAGFTTTIVSLTATTIQCSTTPSASAAAAPVTALPWGNGDGSTTFNVADMRGRAAIGRDSIGGTAAGVLTYPWAARVGGIGGEMKHALAVSELPVFTPSFASFSITQAPHSHAYTQTNNQNSPLINNGASFTTNLGANTVQTGNATPAITGTFNFNSIGGGLPSNVVQPSRAMNWYVFLGE